MWTRLKPLYLCRFPSKPSAKQESIGINKNLLRVPEQMKDVPNLLQPTSKTLMLLGEHILTQQPGR